METMGSRSATELLLLPVRLRGIRLGRPVDLLVDPDEWRVVGFVVLCGDEIERFLVFAAADAQEDELDVSSALLLLEDVDFYRERSRSLRALLGSAVVDRDGRPGVVRDLLLRRDGTVDALLVQQGDAIREVEPAEATVDLEHVSTA